MVVSGAPGTGKSSVVAGLVQSLGRPLLSLDVVNEALADSLGFGDEHWSNKLGDAAAEVIQATVGSLGGPGRRCRNRTGLDA